MDQAYALRGPAPTAPAALFHPASRLPFRVPCVPGPPSAVLGMPPILAVTSGKGGVGKTTIAVNLAILLARGSLRVLLVDGDWGLPNADVALGLVPTAHLGHVLAGRCSLREALQPGPNGMLLLANAAGIPELADAPRVGQVLDLLAELNGVVDLVLVDTAPGIGAGTLEFLVRADRALLVTTPDPTALADAYGLIKGLHIQGCVTKLDLVVNQCEGFWQAQEICRRLNLVTRRYLDHTCLLGGWLPTDPAITEALRSQQALVQRAPRALAVRGLRELAERVLAWARERERRPPLAERSCR